MGPDDPAVNPFLRARIPTLLSFLNHVIPLDALMGMEGLPQSGTGQTALFTGQNAAQAYGRHFGPWVPVMLRPLMMEQSLLSRAQRRGLSCAFANALPAQFLHQAWTKRPAGPPLAAKGAGLLFRTETHLARGEAVSGEFVNTTWRDRLGLMEVPDITLQDAALNLAAIVEASDLTLFAHYATDTAGHRRSMEAAVKALQRLDSFLGHLIPALPGDTLLILASDHGNIEDVTQGHTRNPTFNVLVGPGAREIGESARRITDLVDPLLDRFLTSA